MATVGLHQGFFFFLVPFFSFFSEVQNWIYNSLRDSSKREGNIFVLWALGLELCVQNQCSVLLCAGNGMAPGGGWGAPCMGRALCAPPESLAGGSCLTSPPSSHFPPALCSQQEQRVQGLLGVGSGEGALGLESAVRMQSEHSHVDIVVPSALPLLQSSHKPELCCGCGCPSRLLPTLTGAVSAWH